MEKKYINGMNGKKITGQYGDFYNISINYEKLKEYVNEKGYINITMSPRKETGQYGETETFTLNEWKPKEDNNSGNNSNNSNSNDISIDSCPF